MKWQWELVLMPLASLVFLAVGWHLRKEADRVSKGEKPKDPVAFHAAARYPTGDFGEYWKRKDDPDRVRVWGWLLMIIGVGGIIQTLWRAMRALSGTW